MTVSMLSTFFSGSKKTRLLKHGMAGQDVEMVPVSWMAKPWGRSSRCMMFSVPPDFGVWLRAGPLTTSAGRAARTMGISDARRAVMESPPEKTAVDARSVREKYPPHNMGPVARREMSRMTGSIGPNGSAVPTSRRQQHAPAPDVPHPARGEADGGQEVGREEQQREQWV